MYDTFLAKMGTVLLRCKIERYRNCFLLTALREASR